MSPRRRSLFLVWLALAGVFVGSLPRLALAGSGFEDVRVEGNVALPETVYQTILARTATIAPAGSPLEKAQKAAELIQTFLEEAGYELATATGTVTEDGQPTVALEEGQLDRILFIGVGGGTALGFQLSLDLPGRVFNREQVEKELDRLVRESGVQSATYEIVPTQSRARGLLNVNVPKKVATVTLLREATPFELRVYVEQKAWTPGFQWGLGFSPPDGISVDASWRFADVFLLDDRLTVDGGLSVDVFELADEPEDRLGLTRAAVEAQWFTPPLGADWLRLHLDLGAKVLGRDREDIFVDTYLFSPLAASANVGFIFDTFEAYVGAGIEQRFVYRFQVLEDDEAPDPLPVPIPDDGLLPFFAFGSRWNLSPRELRLDRRQIIQLDGRILSRGTSNDEGQLELFASYRNTWMNGWDEIRLGVKAAYLAGAIPFQNEVAFGEGYLRAAFLDSIFARRIASVLGEYRASLSRDDLKVGFFYDAAVYDALDLARDSDGPRFVNDAGVSLHFLAFETFQIDVYTGVGVTTSGDVDLGISVAGAQVF